MSLEQSEKVAFLSIIFNALLTVMKYVLALLSGSVALMADAIHSLTDVVSSASVLMGIKLSKRRSKTFPYGLYKVENLVSLVMSLLIFVAGYEIFREAFAPHEPLHVELIPWAIAGVTVAILATYLFSRYQLRIGRQINSPSVIADAQHIKTDMFSSIIIMVGLVGGLFRIPYLDKGAALVIVFFIARTGYRILVDAIRVLLDASLDFETLDRVKTLILSEPQVKGIKGLWGRNSGRYRFIEADLTLKVRDLEKAHFVSDKIAERIKTEIPYVDHVLIHYEPVPKETITFVVPLDRDKETISEHFGEAPYFYLITLQNKDGGVLEEGFLNNPHLQEEEGKGIKVSEWLVQKGVDTVFTKKSFEGKGPFYVFSNAEVEMILTPEKRLRDLEFSIKN
ncbi:MAG: cation diffusion facilitator family transporter [Deltaproteobacteria bacterium]|nr:cation diffusion facilitator family transporter [Deltaproteobacteria bacterium]